ncbi:MAG: hypothetical protein ACREMV_09670 [Gemmatimonadales bacterium]
MASTNDTASKRTAFGNERGVALVIIIFGLVVLVGLIAGIFTASVLEHRTGQGFRPSEQAFNSAEAGLTEALADWNSGEWNLLPVLGTSTFAGSLPGGTGAYSGSVRRLSNEIFLLDVTGTSARGDARQRLGVYAKLRQPSMGIEAALTIRGRGRIGGNARVQGVDSTPPGWASCPPVGGPQAGIRTPDASELDFFGACSGASCVTGTPKIEQDPGIDDSTFFNYGDADWASLIANADKQFPGGSYQQLGPRLTADGKCDTAHPLNWGDPINPVGPCRSYFPIIHVNGDLTVSAGVGQGLLLIEGDLHAQGGFEFYGIVIIKGRLKTAGSGNHFNGGVMAANVDLQESSALGDAEIQFSSCAVLRAQQAAGVGAPLRTRGWVQLF